MTGVYTKRFTGSFGMFSWPTEWFYKPPYLPESDSAVIISLLSDLQNYDRSELKARQSGVLLEELLTQLRSKYSTLDVIAHSMGNVVTSEALRDAGSNNIVNTYIATQAAESAQAYYQLMPDMVVPLQDLPGGSHLPNDSITFETAWRTVNEGSSPASPFDIPPNKYQYDIPQIHDLDSTKWGSNYYKGIGSGPASEIVNFNNIFDNALHGWKLNAITKPDDSNGKDPGWNYSFETQQAQSGYVKDHFIVSPPDNQTTPAPYEIFWDGGLVNNMGQKAILSYIIPSRSDPLGMTPNLAGKGEIANSVELADHGFTGSAYDHSAEFLSFMSNFPQLYYWNKVAQSLEITK